MYDVINKTILIMKDKNESERFDYLCGAIRSGNISCKCGSIIDENGIDSYGISSGGLDIDGKRMWVLIKCSECGNVDNWRTVMNRYGI